MTKVSLLLLFFISSALVFSQTDSTNKSIVYEGDFRFRIEHDFNSKKADGTYRSDRSRLRFRFRYGLTYSLNDWASFGTQIRTGNLNDQQGPHITLGGGSGEFSLIQIGLSKAYFKYNKNNISGWIGKNSFPFEKQNELFFNDNISPEGVSLSYKLNFKNSKLINNLAIKGAHFIIKSNNTTFNNDSYLQGLQIISKHLNNKLTLFPSIYHFNKVDDIPDGKGTYTLNYTIFHIGLNYKLTNKLKIGVDYYNNLQNYNNHDSISSNLKNQKQGLVANIKYGSLKQKGNWLFQITYANIQKYSVLDYYAQNDWARWDYSSLDATGSRLSNFGGLEAKVGYAFDSKFNLVLRSYYVEQLVRTGLEKETGYRIRLDLNIGF